MQLADQVVRIKSCRPKHSRLNMIMSIHQSRIIAKHRCNTMLISISAVIINRWQLLSTDDNYYQLSPLQSIKPSRFYQQTVRYYQYALNYTAWFLLENRPIDQCMTPVIETAWLYLMSKPLPMIHDDVIKWKHFPRYWPFVRGIHRSPVNSPHKGQWRGALMFSLIRVWINGWVNNREAGDLRRYRAIS